MSKNNTSTTASILDISLTKEQLQELVNSYENLLIGITCNLEGIVELLGECNVRIDLSNLASLLDNVIYRIKVQTQLLNN